MLSYPELRDIREILIQTAEAAEGAAREATDIRVDGEEFAGHTEMIVGMALRSWGEFLPTIEDRFEGPLRDLIQECSDAVGRTLVALRIAADAELGL